MKSRNKIFLRLASLMFSLLMLTTVFASCGKKTEADEQNQEEDSDALQEGGLNGFTLNVLSRGAYYTDTPAVLMYTEEANGDSMREAVYERNAKLQAKYGLEVSQTFIDNDDRVENEVTKMVASQDDAYQAVTTHLSTAMSYATQNIYDNVLTIPHLKLEEEYWMNDTMQLLSQNGYCAGLLGDIIFGTYEGMYLTMYNTPLANDFGIENLYDVTNAGKWTYDRMITEMEKVITDLNNDGQFGVDDRVGLLYCSNAAGMYLSSTDLYFVKRDSEGQYYFDETVNELADNLCAKASELIKPKGHTWDWLQMSSDNAMTTIISMIENKQALFQNMGIHQVRRFYRQIKTDFGLLPLPKLSEDQNGYYSPGNDECISVPSSNTQLEKTGYALQALGEGSADFPNVYFHVCLESKFTRDEESIDMIMLCEKNQIVDPMSEYDFGGFSSALAVVIKNGRSYMNVYSNLQDAIIEGIEEFNATTIQ